jgi:hypothetical protein
MEDSMNDPIEWLKRIFRPDLTPEANPGQFKRDRGPDYNSEVAHPLNKRVDAKYRDKEEVPAWMDKLFKSPLADTLYELNAGSVPNLGSSRNPAVWGQIENLLQADMFGRRYLNDVVTMNPDSMKYREAPTRYRDASPLDKRNVFIHEMAHVTDKGRDNFPFKPVAKLGRDGADKLDSYYAQSRNVDESFAQAFVNAFNFLSETAKNPTMDYRKFAGELEANTPGMGIILEDLLKSNVYNEHPLRGKIFTQVAAEDFLKKIPATKGKNVYKKEEKKK